MPAVAPNPSLTVGTPRRINGIKVKMQRALKGMQVPQEEILDLITQLGIMFETGLNLAAALEVLERQAGSTHLTELVGGIRRSVEAGQPLSQAMAEHDWAFNSVALALVRAGEATGDLGSMLRKVADFMERDLSTRKRVKGAMAYPAFMLILAVCVVVFLLINVFPKFAELFGDHAELPGPTKFFLALSDFITGHGVWLLPGSVVGFVALMFLCKSRRGRELLHPMYLRIPAFGSLIRAVDISRSFHVLGVMMASGLNVLEALGLAGDVSGNNEYTKLWKRCRKDVESGKNISGTLLDNPLVPPTETAMVSLGERSGTLPDVLEKITKHHEKKVDRAIKAFVGTIEPAMTIIMGAVVALIVSSLIMPMFGISKALK